jgi:DNA adenine methylase
VPQIINPSTEKFPRSPVKWAGGKNRLLIQILPLLPDRFDFYMEPFIGGGAVFFRLMPTRAVLIDSNDELINFYQVVRDQLEALLTDLKKHRNTAEYYYHMRALDPLQMDRSSRASRFLYLNKTGYNGLWRVNKKGKYNVPFGRYKNPKLVDRENLRSVSKALQRAEIITGDFSMVLDYVQPRTFVYLDPPYHPVSRTARFTSYTSAAFGEEEQRRLAGVFNRLHEKDCRVMLSNSDTSLIRELYREYDQRVVYAPRAINCLAGRRGPVAELVIRNYT